MWILTGVIKYESLVILGVFTSQELALKAELYAKTQNLDYSYYDIDFYPINLFSAYDGETEDKQFKD